MIEIIPAVLPKNFNEIEEKLGQVVGATEYAQIDICDGKLTGDASWPHLGKGFIDFEKLINQQVGLPHWEDFNFEIDLMISGTAEEISKAIDDWGIAGGSRVIIHPIIHHQFVRSNEDLKMLFERARFNNMEAGLAIHIETPIEQLADAIKDADVIQCMGIAKIGYQGEKLTDKVFENIERVLAIKPDAIICVDGGVTLDNAEDLADAGVKRLVAGSAIFTNADPRAAIEYLKGL